MGCVVQVDPDRVAAAAADLALLAADLEGAGEALARVLQLVAGAAGGGALSAAAGGAAREWQQGMCQVADHGSALARATGEAAQAYRAVEALHTGVWGAGGGTRWSP